MIKITMISNFYQLKQGTKTSYKLVKSETKEITDTEYDNITNKNTLSWFRKIGGSEFEHKAYTYKGYVTTKLISKSPDRITKHVRLFDFSLVKNI